MANANEARRVNLANSRSLIETDSLSLAEKLLAEMHRRINEQADLIAADDLNRMFGTAVDKAIALAKLNDDHGASAARSMLDRIAEQIGVPNE
jgi:citrate lyase beta subunit